MSTRMALLLCAAAALAQMAPVPGSSRQITDSITAVPLTVTVPDFLIDSRETTQADYEQLAGNNPSHHRGPRLPVESVTWWDAIRYANLRSIREKLEPVYDLATGRADFSRNGYRLPTDAEWQLAAGSAKPSRETANLGTANTKSMAQLAAELREGSTKPVGSYPANERGLHDMAGNVWEWCHDWFDPQAGAVFQASNPRGPARGLDRIIRGGSFLSTVSSWSRGYRSSMPPDHKSRFLGFRLARSAPSGERVQPSNWLSRFNQPPPAFANQTGGLAPLLAQRSESHWRSRRAEILEKWRKILGLPATPAPAPAVKTLATFDEATYTGHLMMLQVERDWWEKIYLMIPHGAHAEPRPAVIAPYYDVDTPAGRNLGGRNFLPPSIRSFALSAVQRGHIAVAIRWFGESYGESYTEAVANLGARHPDWTGLGKWTWDARRLVDYLYTLPQVDRARIGIIGQSLGGKMSLYAAAFDERISAAASSECGIGLGFSNYEDYWYLGERARTLPPGTDHHELLGLIAPRPFLLIGGDSADNDKSWYYINAARPLYELFGKPDRIGYFNHRKGHTPTPEAAGLAMDWLDHFLHSVKAAR